MTSNDLASNDQLIARLSAELVPVQRLPAPWIRAALWLTAAAALIGLEVLVSGLRSDLAEQWRDWCFHVDLWCSLAGGIAAALASFHLAQPGRSLWWIAAPVPFLVFWTIGMIADTGWDMLFGAGWVFGTSWHCVQVIIQTSVPLLALGLWMLKRAYPETPTVAACCIALAASFLTAAGLSLYHTLYSGLMVLVWHGGAALLVALVASAVGRRWL